MVAWISMGKLFYGTEINSCCQIITLPPNMLGRLKCWEAALNQVLCWVLPDTSSLSSQRSSEREQFLYSPGDRYGNWASVRLEPGLRFHKGRNKQHNSSTLTNNRERRNLDLWELRVFKKSLGLHAHFYFIKMQGNKGTLNDFLMNAETVFWKIKTLESKFCYCGLATFFTNHLMTSCRDSRPGKVSYWWGPYPFQCCHLLGLCQCNYFGKYKASILIGVWFICLLKHSFGFKFKWKWPPGLCLGFS